MQAWREKTIKEFNDYVISQKKNKKKNANQQQQEQQEQIIFLPRFKIPSKNKASIGITAFKKKKINNNNNTDATDMNGSRTSSNTLSFSPSSSSSSSSPFQWTYANAICGERNQIARVLAPKSKYESIISSSGRVRPAKNVM